MRIIIAGASGFLGTHVRRALVTAGHNVRQLVRRPATSPSEWQWDPARDFLPADALAGQDCVINFCGAGVGDRRWTAARKTLLRSSRIPPTALLARACAAHKVPAMLSASAVGFYGNRYDESLDESAAAGTGFLSELCVEWEQATAPAADSGVRVVQLRTGLVLGSDGGMLPQLTRLGKLLLGGRLGSGQQWWPWIAVDDYVAAVEFLLDAAVAGPVNMTAPHPVTNAEFTRELAAVLRRPAPWVIPGFALKAVLGGFAGEILGGQRALPQVLAEAGFNFRFPQLRPALEQIAGRGTHS